MNTPPVFVTGGTGYFGRHRWPVLMLPAYALLRLVPATREATERLGLVTRAQMVAALLDAVANPPRAGVRIVDVPAIRRCPLTPPPTRDKV